MILFYDRGCPAAHRVRALIAHLGCPVDLREALIGDTPPGLSRYSAGGSLPLWVQGDLVLTESRVMLEHLAEQHDLAGAYPAALDDRSRHRRAMAVVDGLLLPLLFGPGDAAVDPARLHDALGALQDAAASAPRGRPCLLALHVAPIWLRFRLWHPRHAVTRAVEARPVLRDVLDAAVQLDCVQRTAPDRHTIEEDLLRARRAGLLPPDPGCPIDPSAPTDPRRVP